MAELAKVVRLVLAVMLATIVFNTDAGAGSKPLDESQQLFFSQFRYAVQARDTGQLIRLTHPRSLDCVAEDDRVFYYGKILDGLVRVFGKRQTVHRVTVTEFSPGEMDVARDLPSGDKVIWPVTPEARLIIQYEQQERKAVASLYLTKENTDWKWIHICIQE